MDKAREENYDGPAKEESDQFFWLAGALVGGVLILMIIIIIGIIIWKHVKKQNTRIDQNWAGPSPLAEGGNPEGNCMNSSIFGRSMSLSGVSTSPILSNEPQKVQGVHEITGEMQKAHFKEKEVNEKKLSTSTISTQIVPAVPTKNASQTLDAQTSTQITENGLNNERFPPPPLDLPQEFPMPAAPDAFPEQDIKNNCPQRLPESNSYRQDENGNKDPFNPQISGMDALHNTTNLEAEPLPPPPPDF